LLDRLVAALADRYRVERELGHGGMATVYLAEDLKYHRLVAVKVLRPELAATLGADRFLREIQVAAQLQHPHILPLLDSGEANGFFYYVMPLVEGESLRARLAHHGELPVHDAVRILKEVVDALAHAHAHGVVHRDIKPDNILLSGRHALVSDFGVAKAVSEATGRQTFTTAGVALGTPAYMAPEQAAADPHLDHRVDLYAVGALGYELLSGRPPFTGLTPQEVLAAHVTQAPEPVDKHRPGLSPTLTQVIMRCLAKRPADRWQTAEELLAQLEPLVTPSGGMTPIHPAAAVPPTARWLKVAMGAAGLVVAVAATRVLTRSRPEVLTLGKVTQLTFEPGLEIEPAISPDGKLLAYAAGPLSAMKIYVRQPGGRPIALAPDTRVPQRRPVWSPDGTRILFETDQDLFVMPAPVTDNAALNVSPVWTPDSRRILFVSDRDGARDVYAVRLASSGMPAGKPSRITAGLNAHAISLSGDGTRLAYSVYTSRANVWAIPIPTDGPISVDRATQITTGNQTVEEFAVSPDGRWLYFDSDRSGNADLCRMSLGGGEPQQLTTDPADDFSPDVSPDGRWVAFHSLRFGTRDAFVMSAEGGEAQRVTDDSGEERSPMWSPDGRSLAYTLSGTGTRDGPYVISKQGSRWGLPRRVGNPSNRTDWSPDGRTLLSTGNDGIWLIPIAGDASPGRAYPLSDTINPLFARWSPDGRTIYVKAVDREGRASFWALPSTGGRPRLLVRFDDPAKPSMREQWVTDGRRFYFAIEERQSDIYLAELRGLR
jgi:Tol biopolymer transport system component/tRNA A-37 threonylcarbamoyl transferase component Bud32